MKKIIKYLKDLWERKDNDNITYSEVLIVVCMSLVWFIGFIIRFITLPIWILPYVVIKSRKA